MPITTTSAFKAQAAANSNTPKTQVQLLLGDYCISTVTGAVASASSTDGSGNFPASGANNGDRTELNIGAASGADNGIGRSSWKSAIACPGSPSFISYKVTFLTGTTVNRVKIYHLSGHGLKSFALFALDFNSNFIPIGTTTGTPWVIAPIATNSQLDTFDFADIPNVYAIFLLIYDTQVAADKPTIVEFEAYRRVDITSRTINVQLTQSRDYKLVNPMASSCKITVDNSDRFFSPSHNPTPAELNAGFVNNELGPQIGVIVTQGFALYSGPAEIYNTFIGFVDDIVPNSRAKMVTINARDAMKNIVNKIDSTNLKTSIDISAAIQYVLNRCNISNWEMSIDTTGIILSYFFTDAEQQLTTIQNLVQASGDAIFYFDQNGTATFRFYTQGVVNQFIYTSQTDWQAGALTAIDTTTVAGDMLADFSNALAEFNGGTITNLGAWRRDSSSFTGVGVIFQFGGGGSWTIGGNGLQIAAGNTGFAELNQFGWVGRWDVKLRVPPSRMRWVFASKNQFETNWANSYSLLFTWAAGVFTCALCRKDNMGVSYPVADVTLASATITPGASDLFTVVRYPSGRLTVKMNGGALFDVVDSTYNGVGMNYSGFDLIDVAPAAADAFGYAAYFNPNGFVGDNILPVLNTGGSTTGFLLLTATLFKNSGDIYFKTRSGPAGHPVPDGSWSAWSAAFQQGAAIPSPTNQYLQVDVFLDTTPNLNLANPDVLDVTVNWTVGTGSPKYPLTSSFTFRFDSSLLDIQQQISDTLGGNSAIINDAAVQAKPLALTGTSSDTQWQGTVGTPPTPISGGTPLTVANGVLLFPVYIPGGMDISIMTGANPAAAVVTFGGGAVGSWIFSVIHPTHPVLQVTITNPGNITDLRVVGKKFQSTTFTQVQEVIDTLSVLKYGGRQQSLGNQWIVSATIASLIASTLVAVSKRPVQRIPTAVVRFEPDLLLGDRVTVVDLNLDLSGDYIAVGVVHTFDPQSKKIDTSLDLLAVP